MSVGVSVHAYEHAACQAALRGSAPASECRGAYSAYVTRPEGCRLVDVLSRAKRALGRERDAVAREGSFKTAPKPSADVSPDQRCLGSRRLRASKRLRRGVRALGPWRAWCGAGILALAALLVGCDGEAEARAWITASAADSAAADRALAEGDATRAEARLEALVAREVPEGVARSDARVVRQDAYDRLARIALAAGALPLAERRVAEGLDVGRGEDVFTVSLLTTRGRIHEAAGRDREAAADYHRALVISEALLEQALAGGAREGEDGE